MFTWITEKDRAEMARQDKELAEAMAECFQRLTTAQTKTDADMVIPASERSKLYAKF